MNHVIKREQHGRKDVHQSTRKQQIRRIADEHKLKYERVNARSKKHANRNNETGERVEVGERKSNGR